MGKASRGKRERFRDQAGQWTASGAARTAQRMRRVSLTRLSGNSWVQMMLAENVNNVLGELHGVLLNSNFTDVVKTEGLEWQAAMSMVLGKQGLRPPWPRSPGEAAAWQMLGHGEMVSLWLPPEPLT
ncbi:hypothetical protein BIV25_45005 [Streptomyces sp. MUSC 14]|uniref:hypothetical protein n=1 Tax=Streptomyces sp. MUSC 14 TaxID=1354889 RepID=UPI0008F56C6B|nr:hypothetical protein [Streptomyces sp. MUSC 14]OIJ85067.1 hypothetical protein BIV25_45005 [Streptomyces sp. MUSC 14]